MRRPPIRPLAAGLLAALAGFAASAAPVYLTLDLRNGTPVAPPAGFVSYASAMADSNADGWYEAVLKIDLSVYRYAQFRITYDSAPTGFTVNIGDSESNNGGGGDGGHQSNDAELQLGSLMGDTANYDRLLAIGNDGHPSALATVPALAGTASDLFLTVGDQYAAWDNGQGTAGSVTSPYLFALGGQADSEGPVNYDIYAGFNRSIGTASRLGAGVSQVTVCLSDDASCFGTVPLPATLPLALLALGLMRPALRAGARTAPSRRPGP